MVRAWGIWLVVAGIFLLAGAMPAARAAEYLTDSQLQFTLTVPDGFERAPQYVGYRPQIAYAFARGENPTLGRNTFLFIEKLGGTIGTGHLTQADLPPGSDARFFTTRWSQYELDAAELREVIGGVPVLTYIVQVPLRPQAIQIRLCAPASGKAGLDQLLTCTLLSLHGPTNWPAAGSMESYGTVLLSISIVVIIGGLVVFWRIGRNAPKGTLAGIAVPLYLTGMALGQIQVREIVLASGICKMLATGTFLIGLIQSFRKAPAVADPDAHMGDDPASW